MSTRSFIALKENSTTIKYIYCHWDGYPSYNGRLLLRHYNDINRIQDLLKLGDLSSLGENPTTQGDFDAPHNEKFCCSYADRGECFPALTVKNKTEFKRRIDDSWVEYAYLYDKGKWYYTNKRPYQWRLLTMDIIEEEEEM